MTKNKLEIKIKLPAALRERMLDDLRREHSYAFERVGFMYTTSTLLSDNTLLILATDYEPVADEDYINDDQVGAKINSEAIRKAMQGILERKGGCFHVHLHDHSGTPTPSSTDKSGLPKVAESFANIAAGQANGILILSEDSFYAIVKIRGQNGLIRSSAVFSVGYPMHLEFHSPQAKTLKKMFSRQSFLNYKSAFIFDNIKVAIIGYGGGGSHIGQQLAHIGVKNILVFDADIIEDTNMNRLVGGRYSDIKKAVLKTSIAKRVITNILPDSKIISVNSRWQENPELLQSCDIAFGGVDSYIERQQLEAECRRYLIPYIDIGMDVHENEDLSYSMTGQVILSMPGRACMSCLGFLTEEKIAAEAAKYGAVGGRPQVVWPNGVLASTAVGVFVDLVTGWSKKKDNNVYLSYDGNNGVLSNHIRLRFAPDQCSHYPISEVGPPKFNRL